MDRSTKALHEVSSLGLITPNLIGQNMLFIVTLMVPS